MANVKVGRRNPVFGVSSRRSLRLLVEDCQNVNCPHDTVCLLVKNTGEPFCYPKKHCHRVSNSEPVCGTDGVTYSNTCTMRLNPDAQGRTAEVAHKGPCGKSSPSARILSHSEATALL